MINIFPGVLNFNQLFFKFNYSFVTTLNFVFMSPILFVLLDTSFKPPM